MTDHLPSAGPVGDLPEQAVEAAAEALRVLDTYGARKSYRAMADAVLAAVLPLIRAHIADQITAERVELRQGATATAKNQIRLDAHNGAIAAAARVARGGTDD